MSVYNTTNKLGMSCDELLSPLTHLCSTNVKKNWSGYKVFGIWTELLEHILDMYWCVTSVDEHLLFLRL